MKQIIPTIRSIEKYATLFQSYIFEIQAIVESRMEKFILPYIRNIGSKILTKLFPFEPFDDRPSVFIQQTWIEKIMNNSQVKDYLWHPTKSE